MTLINVIALFLLLVPAVSAQAQTALSGPAAGSYFPLDVGNRWVFRIDTRQTTASYQTWRVDRTEPRNGVVWSVIAIEDGNGMLLAESLFRPDSQGRVYYLAGSGEQLFLDPTNPPGANPVLEITGQIASASTAVGTFPDALSYRNVLDALDVENGTLVRGIGVVASRRDIMAGSSGGFSSSRALVEASLAGGIELSVAAPSVELGIENLVLNVSEQQVTNCAVPCYFVACGLVPGADPPNTYKPCVRARVELGNWPSGASRTLRLQLIGPDGAIAIDQALQLGATPKQSVGFVQLPLYSSPNQPLPAGAYQLLAVGAGGAQASLMLKIQ